MLRLLDSKGKPTGNTLPVPGMSGVPTNSHGRFTIVGVPEGKYYLWVVAGGYQSFGRSVAVSPNVPASFEAALVKPKHLLVKVLSPSGKPVVKKAVYVSMLVGRRWRRATCSSDTEGCCRLTLCRPRKVFAHVPGVGSNVVDADPKAPADTPVEIHLASQCTVSGTVKERGSGRPVGGVQVRFASLRLGKGVRNLSPYPRTVVNTNAQGVFSLRHIPAGRCTFSVSSSRVLKCDSVAVALQPGHKAQALTFQALLAPKISAKLLGVAGSPVATLRSIALRQWVRQANGKCKSFTTQAPVDANGQLCVDARMLGKTRIGVSVPSEGWALSEWIEVTEGKDVTVDIRLQSLGMLRGIVREAGSNKPVRGATIKIAPIQTTEPSLATSAEAQTDHQGRFVVSNLPPSAYKISAAAFGYRASRPIDATVGARLSEATIELEKAAVAQ